MIRTSPPLSRFSFVRRALAAALLATIASGQARANGLVIFGYKDEGGGIDAFEKVIDFATGSERIIEMQGISSAERGFDGRYWSSGNGTLTTVDLPSEVADRHAERWIYQNVSRITAPIGKFTLTVRPPGASRVTVEFDRNSKLPTKAVVDSDYGAIRHTFVKWRMVGKRRYPFLIERLTDTGEHTKFHVQSVRVVKTVDPQLITRPTMSVSPAKLSKPVVVPFRTSGRGTHMLVDAIVDGKAGEFVFDTGAANIFTVDAAKQRGIEAKGGLSVSGVGEGSTGGGFTVVKSVSLGDATLTDQNFMIIPPIFPTVDGKPSPTQGLLGFEFFAHFVTTIDYKTKTLTFRNQVPSGQRGTRLPFFSDGHSLYVEAKVNGRPGLFRLDTGDGGGVTLFPAFSARAQLTPDSTPRAASGGGVGGGVLEARGSIDRFELGGITVDRLAIRFALNSKGAFASRYLAGNLGGRILSCFRMTLDHDHHQLWLEPQTDTPTCQLSARTPGAN